MQVLVSPPRNIAMLAFCTLLPYDTANTIDTIKMSSPSKLPAWPLTNMGTAEFTTTDNAFVGENTVIGEYIYSEGFNGCIHMSCTVLILFHLFSCIP